MPTPPPDATAGGADSDASASDVSASDASASDASASDVSASDASASDASASDDRASPTPRREPVVVVVDDDDEDEGPDPMIGQVLSGLYKVQTRIGRGGMGTVYMALHVHLDKPFAVKVLSDQIAANKTAVQRLLQEARTASSIDHDNIVDVISFDATEDGRVFLVMELLEGLSLAELVERGPMKLERALPIARQVCQALQAAHARGIVHRDLKPENVFICRKHDADFVKVLDFGISKVRAADAEQVRVTKTGQLVGTPLYMSPEQARGESDIDQRADVYALGVMLFEMLTGHPPFDGTNYFQLLWKHGNEPAPSARVRRPDLPEAIDRVLLRALEKRPEARFGSMHEMEEALVAAAPEVGSPERLLSMPPRSVLEAPRSPTPGAASPAHATTPSRKPWLVAAGAIALLGGGFAFARLTNPPTPSPVSPDPIVESPTNAPRRDEAPMAPAPTPMAPAPPSTAPASTAPAPPSTAPTSTAPASPVPIEPVAPAPVLPVPWGVLPPALVRVQLRSTPSGASVRIAGEYRGQTPLDLELPPTAPVSVRLSLAGHASSRVTFVPSEGLEQEVRLLPLTRPMADDLPIRTSL